MARISTLQGRARLERKLKSLSTSVKAPIRAAIAQGAEQIVAMAKNLVPEDTGALKESIGWTWGRAVPKGSIVLAATKRLGDELTATIYAGSNEAFYSRWIEFSTVNMPASPFFFPAWRANRKPAKNRIARAVRKAARAAAR
jgi:HK97 gp10 family phage protein